MDVRLLMLAVSSLFFAQAHAEPSPWSVLHGVLGLCFAGRALLATRIAPTDR